MAEARCGICGGPVAGEAGRDPLTAEPVCVRCAADRVQRAPGETVVAGSLASRAGLELDPYRTGTIVLAGEERTSSAPAVEVKVKGFLNREGVPTSEADFRLRGVTVVGRQEGDLVVDDPTVSARHFQIEERGGAFFVRDLGSSNGTFVNDRPVRTARLQTGDRIQAGTTRFTFSVRHSIPT